MVFAQAAEMDNGWAIAAPLLCNWSLYNDLGSNKFCAEFAIKEESTIDLRILIKTC